ncbi:DUF4381 domain-containing protein [Rhizobium sp. Root1204]|uniref:DUF4381 domain-containing protein n=1 Tax=Rhizobium sp. Root1204 TaxID=1736428 RepID=UPI0007150986|nr:DUF4381 domain-containing protein [Rhizobium sp. Root1204]KQV38612.1 hypothetical protein ASC96_25030 [Rhizobium sp. Root1204]
MEPDKVAPLDPLTKLALKQLKDISVPEPVSWMPQTWGWGVVAFLLLCLIVFLSLQALRRYRANAYRRQALAELRAIELRIREPQTRHDAVDELAELLKRVALAAWRREDVAALSGAAWVDFLEKHSEAGTAQSLRTLLDAYEYRHDPGSGGMPDTVFDDYISSARSWIGRHHVSA